MAINPIRRTGGFMQIRAGTPGGATSVSVSRPHPDDTYTRPVCACERRVLQRSLISNNDFMECSEVKIIGLFGGI